MSFEIVKKFEEEIALFFGAPYAVAVDCCTHGIELCIRYKKPKKITIPTHTYISIPFLGDKLGIDWTWKEEEWKNYYYIGETNIIDAAVFWKRNGYIERTLMCLSFQFQKHLSLGRGGMILTDNINDRNILKKMSYDGRCPDTPWRNQNINLMGYHYYMTPEIADLGLKKLADAKNRKPKNWVLEDWPDLRRMDIFK